MQPGPSYGYGTRRNNSYATDGEPIEIDQRSIVDIELPYPDDDDDNDDNNNDESEDDDRFSQSPPPQLSDFQPHRLHPHQMGQGASIPRTAAGTVDSDIQSSGRRSDESSQQQTSGGGGGGGGNGAGGDTPERAALAARLRRSRRLRNHVEHITRLGTRLMPTGTSSSSASSSSNSSTIRNRVPGIRFRPRSMRFAGSRSRSPSPGRRGSDSTEQRRRTLPPMSRPIPLPPVTDLIDMMDISPVSTVTPHSQSQAAPMPSPVPSPPPSPSPPLPPTTGSRRSRMSRVRDSISSWPNLMSSELGSIISRPSLRRPSEAVGRSGTLDTLDNSNRSTTNMDVTEDTTVTAAAVTDTVPAPPPSEESNRQVREGDSLLAAGQSLLDGLPGSGRARSGEEQAARSGEDQAAMLSRLLSVAAAATAASLVGNAEDAIRQAEDVGGDNGGDGSFEAFLRALQNGRLEAALRNGGNEMGGGGTTPAPEGENGVLSLNFFRMFRFGSTPASNSSINEEEQTQTQGSRMVPVIIVGIRSVSPRETDGSDGNPRPTPFFDALANLPVSIPGVHRRPRFGAGTGGGHRRAASTGSSEFAPNSTSSTSTSTDTDTPSSSPPTTPADSTPPSSTSPTPPLSSTPSSPPHEDALFRRRLPRRLSSPDRPSNAPAPPPEGTRSWIIYVLGGSYPENHPILTTPSLFTDEPTYEDMTLLSSLLGPAKLPVAAKEDIDQAGGVFVVSGEEEEGGLGGERCLVCLGDYEVGNECRRLRKCNHVFHRECIDEWLTTGRNSCPLCRGEGVEEKSKAAGEGAEGVAAS